MNIQQLIVLGGTICQILYPMLWILSDILQPGYSHIRDDLSSLLFKKGDYIHVSDRDGKVNGNDNII